MRASVVIPTFNEAENIGLLLGKLQEVFANEEDVEFVVVDDDSPDLTWQIAQRVASGDARIKVIRRIGESGLSSAIIRGIQTASGDAIAVMDADLQHDETALPAMIREIEAGADVCIGSRKAEGGGFGEWSLKRRFASWGATRVAQVAVRTHVTDPMSGFFCVSRHYFSTVEGQLNPRGFKVLLELLVRGESPKIAEVGYVFRNRMHGETKLTGGVAYEYLLGLIDLRLGRVVSSTSVTYLLVTIAGMFANLLSYLTLRLLDVPRTGAGIIGFEVAVLITFLGHNFLTFAAQSYAGRRVWLGLLLYQTVSLFGALVQYSVFEALRVEAPFSEVSVGGSFAANGIAILVAAVSTYSLHLGYTWRRIGGFSPEPSAELA